MKIAKGETARVFIKTGDDGSENIYTGIISNIGNEQRRCYLSVFMGTDLKLKYLDAVNYEGKGYADIQISFAWLTCDMRGRAAIYIKDGIVK